MNQFGLIGPQCEFISLDCIHSQCVFHLIVCCLTYYLFILSCELFVGLYMLSQQCCQLLVARLQLHHIVMATRLHLEANWRLKRARVNKLNSITAYLFFLNYLVTIKIITIPYTLHVLKQTVRNQLRMNNLCHNQSFQWFCGSFIISNTLFGPYNVLFNN